MKKILALLLIFALVFSLPGCGKPNADKACDQAAKYLMNTGYDFTITRKLVENKETGDVDKVLLWVEYQLQDYSDYSNDKEGVYEASEVAVIRREVEHKATEILSEAGVELVLCFLRYNGSLYGFVSEGKLIRD